MLHPMRSAPPRIGASAGRLRPIVQLIPAVRHLPPGCCPGAGVHPHPPDSRLRFYAEYRLPASAGPAPEVPMLLPLDPSAPAANQAPIPRLRQWRLIAREPATTCTQPRLNFSERVIPEPSVT